MECQVKTCFEAGYGIGELMTAEHDWVIAPGTEVRRARARLHLPGCEPLYFCFLRPEGDTKGRTSCVGTCSCLQKWSKSRDPNTM